ncbi:dioxygenase family protein [Sansalvadorimonas verongulae]|uniref:dioxygenase family protein n=1 Tax=Sansalvadorimonas verongulae TaxID=2172824 RepID=UPI0018AD2413|nr:hypothetical protein [Sansalvadorimonas verongulae]
MKRRRFLGNLVTASALAGASSVYGGQCIKVPASGAGPMKPLNKPFLENDLTRVYPNGPEAVGQKMTLSGQVVNEDCEPYSGAEVVIWQACVNGIYNHPNEARKGWRDPNFRYEGRYMTGDNGAYIFHTILPGSYPVPARADAERGLVAFRAPHVHFTVTIPGQEPFTSQMFFDLFELTNRFDLVLYKKTEKQCALLTARVEEPENQSLPMRAHFDIVI